MSTRFYAQREANRQNRPIWYQVSETKGAWIYPAPKRTGRSLLGLLAILQTGR